MTCCGPLCLLIGHSQEIMAELFYKFSLFITLFTLASCVSTPRVDFNDPLSIESGIVNTVDEYKGNVKIEEHIQRIKQCLDRTRQSIFDTVISIKECRNQVSDVDPDWTSDFNLVRASWYHPSPTLTQMGQHGGRGGIHYPDKDRVFTTDELKRLMRLPGDFRLTGTFNQKAERCGRMVTPLLYKHLSKSIYEKVLKG